MRTLHTARLTQKRLLSEPAQCFHLEFTVDALPNFSFEPGQFVSCVAEDARGKQQTRAYSLASAPRGNRFDLCVNRVEDGFFSNLLCDLELGESIHFNGPLGMFTLRQPPVDSLLIATGTGIAPIRGFIEALFPEGEKTGSASPQFWLIYGTRHETELYYEDYFKETARRHLNFHYIATLSRPSSKWSGECGYVQEQAARLLEAQALQPVRLASSLGPSDPGSFNMHAYLCGFRDMIAATRERLVGLGWQKKQILYERYD